MPGIGVINNPHSRKNKRNPHWMQGFGYLVGPSGKAAATRGVDDIHEMARLFREKEIEILAINGGDGSNSVVLTAFILEYGKTPLPKIALLRGGTMNIAANSCGIKGTPAGIMMNLVHKLRDRLPFETTWRDTLKVGRRYGFIFGIGFVHNFMEALYATGDKSVLSTSRLVGKSMLSAAIGTKFAKEMFRRVEARVTVDGQLLPHTSFSAMAASTVEQIGLNFKPFFRCQEQSRSFHLLGALCSPLAFASALPKIYFGRKISEKKLIELVARDVIIEAEQPLGYTLDGENLKGGKKIRITTGPRVEIIVR